VDVKGELSDVTSKQRSRFGEVKFSDPYGEVARYVKGATSSQYNPMARLDPKSIEFAAQAGKISAGLNPDEGQHHRFFSGGARGLCSGIQMGLVRHAQPHEKNLVAMRSVLTGEFQGGVDVFGFAQSIMQNSTDPILRQLVARYAMPGARESRSLADIISTADVNTQFISDYAIAQSLSGSDFSFADLKKEVTTVYVVLPMDYLEMSGYFALIVASALSELLRGKRGIPVLILMDEFALYPLKAIQTAFGNAAGFGVQLWPVLQDLNQIRCVEGWETFLSNAAVRMYFGPRDETTSLYLSGQCGQTERRQISQSISYQDDTAQEEELRRVGRDSDKRMTVPNINVSFGSVARQLLLPHETRELGGDEMLLFVEGVNGVIRANRRPYWEEPEFRGQYAPNPYF
jgi:type IV secretion system protein VirD4